MKIKNKDLANVINLLDTIPVKGLKSIHRTAISERLKDKHEKLVKAQEQLREEYKDDVKGFKSEMEKLLDQNNTIDDTDSKVEIESLKSTLKPLVAEDSEYEFKDGDAIGIAVLYTALNLGGE